MIDGLQRHRTACRITPANVTWKDSSLGIPFIEQFLDRRGGTAKLETQGAVGEGAGQIFPELEHFVTLSLFLGCMVYGITYTVLHEG